MRLLFLGDIVGRAGRSAVLDRLATIRRDQAVDLVIINAENSAAGFGMTAKIADQLFAAGCDVITGGNHSFDQREILPALDREPRILRPLNYPDGTPGHGTTIITGPRGKKLLVINAMGRTFMNPMDCPFRALDRVLKKTALGRGADAIFVDFHGEASSEKMAMGHYLDGRVSAVIGTHTHVPTADAQILPGGTAYQTDAGMCGDYNSVIGMQKDEPIQRFLTKQSRSRYTPAAGEGTLCGVVVETDDATGLARHIEPLRLGPRLIEARPQLN